MAPADQLDGVRRPNGLESMNALASYGTAILPALVVGFVSGLVAYRMFRTRPLVRRVLQTLAAFLAISVSAMCVIGSGLFLFSVDGPIGPLSKPSATHLRGTWVLPDTLVEYLKSKEIPTGPGTLVLRSDGTFEMDGIPNLWGAPWDSSRPPTSGKGTWDIVNQPPGIASWGLRLHFTAVTPESGNDEVVFMIQGRGPPFRLDIPKGDLGDDLILERQ